MRPYLATATDAALEQRFCDVLTNYLAINVEGKIGPDIERESMLYWSSRITHLFEEFGRRGGIPQGAGQTAKFPRPTFPDVPKGAEAFKAIKTPPPGEFLAKFMKRIYAEKLVYKGEVRVAPATTYDDPSLNSALCDDELKVCTCIPKDEMKATVLDKETRKPKGDLELTNDVTVAVTSDTNYYVWCMTSSLSIRLFQDFDVDACVIIHSPSEFAKRLSRAMSKRIVGWEYVLVPVRYIDPYLDTPDTLEPFGCKHFKYAYQKEIRLVWLPRDGAVKDLGPQFLNLGPLDDICELVIA